MNACEQCGDETHACEYPGSYCRWKVLARDRLVIETRGDNDVLKAIARVLREAYELGQKQSKSCSPVQIRINSDTGLYEAVTEIVNGALKSRGLVFEDTTGPDDNDYCIFTLKEIP